MKMKRYAILAAILGLPAYRRDEPEHYGLAFGREAQRLGHKTIQTGAFMGSLFTCRKG